MTEPHEGPHHYEPISGWSGRYCCVREGCGVLAYRRIILPGISQFGVQVQDEGPGVLIRKGHPEAIVPYTCNRTRDKQHCGRPAVRFKKGKTCCRDCLNAGKWKD